MPDPSRRDSMRTSGLAAAIEANACRMRELHAAVHDTHRRRTLSAEHDAAWQAACREFHAQRDTLSFPGGWTGALDRIAASQPQAIDAALVFLELRPYFVGSGYMRAKLLPRLKRAQLDHDQRQRLHSVIQRQQLWQQLRKARG